eukprot:COSAG05_NODE_7299_length_831_cov_1.189891_1_plen_257_part_10
MSATAGLPSILSFQARDRFLNIRLNNDTLLASMTQILNSPQPQTSETLRPEDVALDTKWNPATEQYDVTFNTMLCMQWDDRNDIYNVTVHFKDVYRVKRQVPGSMFRVHVRPNDLDPHESGPGPLSLEVEAGREAVFAVVPRDHWSNIRDIEHFELNDALTVELEGIKAEREPQPNQLGQDVLNPQYIYPRLQFDKDFDKELVATYGRNRQLPSDNSTALQIQWESDGLTPLGLDPALRHHEPHFRATYLVTAQGKY